MLACGMSIHADKLCLGPRQIPRLAMKAASLCLAFVFLQTLPICTSSHKHTVGKACIASEYLDIAYIITAVHHRTQLLASIRSLLFHRTCAVHLHIVCDSDNKQWLKGQISPFNEYALMRVSYYDVPELATEDQLSESVRIQRGPFDSGISFALKLHLSKILEACVERMIFLDADTIVIDDICSAVEILETMGPTALVGFAPEMTLWYVDRPDVGLHIGSDHRHKFMHSQGLNSGVGFWRLDNARRVGWQDVWHPLLVKEMQQRNMLNFELGDQDVFNLISHQKPEWFTVVSWEWNVQLAVCWHYADSTALNKLLSTSRILHGNNKHFLNYAGALIEDVYLAFAADNSSSAHMASVKSIVQSSTLLDLCVHHV